MDIKELEMSIFLKQSLNLARNVKISTENSHG